MTNSRPVYFCSLDVENVRCFGKRQRLDLTDENGNPVQWTLILGDNGVGKTALLQCMAWMRPVPWTNEATGKIEGTQPALNSEENELWHSLIRVGENVDAILEAKLTVGRKFSGQRGDKIANVTTHVEMGRKDGELHYREDPEPAANARSHGSGPDFVMFAYGAMRRPGTLKRDGEDVSDPLASLFRESTELYDAEDILLKLDHRAKGGTKQDKTLLEDVKRLLAAVLPDVADERKIHIRPPRVFGSRRENSGVRFETPYGTVPLSALSLGYRTTLTWITDLALRLYDRYPESPSPLDEPGIVLIDNIDLHLHPRWQRRMMRDISGLFSAVQFIATAHSPLIVQAAENAKLAVLRESDGEVVIDDEHERVNTWRVDQILSSDLFGVPTRSQYIEDMRKERNALSDRTDRSASDDSRLQFLREVLDALPTVEDSEERAALDLIRKVANDLKESTTGGS